MQNETAPDSATNENTITLDKPIKRGASEITQIEINKPNSGALRGVGLRDLLDLDVNALIKVLPRVTVPLLTENEVAEMDPADLTQAGTVVIGFLLSKQVKSKAGI